MKVFAQTAPKVIPNSIKEVLPGEDIFAYINRVKGSFDQTLYRQVIGGNQMRLKRVMRPLVWGPVMKKRDRMRAAFCQNKK